MRNNKYRDAIKKTYGGCCRVSFLFVYTRQSRGFVRTDGRACCFYRPRLARNRGNVPGTGSNEDSAATTTFVRTPDPLRARSIY